MINGWLYCLTQSAVLLPMMAKTKRTNRFQFRLTPGYQLCSRFQKGSQKYNKHWWRNQREQPDFHKWESSWNWSWRRSLPSSFTSTLEMPGDASVRMAPKSYTCVPFCHLRKIIVCTVISLEREKSHNLLGLIYIYSCFQGSLTEP